MRVVTQEQFIKEPCGIIYCTCIDSIFTGDLAIKEALRSADGKSWWALNITPWFKKENDVFSNYPHGEEIKTEAFFTDDAIYNYDKETMFAVFNKDEILGMIDRMKIAIK